MTSVIGQRSVTHKKTKHEHWLLKEDHLHAFNKIKKKCINLFDKEAFVRILCQSNRKTILLSTEDDNDKKRFMIETDKLFDTKLQQKQAFKK